MRQERNRHCRRSGAVGTAARAGRVASAALGAALFGAGTGIVAGTGIMAAGAMAPAQAQTAELCDVYSIRRGDTLSAIAERVYGSRQAFVRFFDDPRNVQSLGDNPNRISIGDQLYLPPCESSDEPLEPLQVQRPVGTGLNLPIEIVTGTDFAPFTSEDLPDGGMVTRLVREAFELSDIKNEVNIDFINDWGSHLTILLPKVKYGFGFPWYQPDCDNRDRLSPTMQVRCDLIWSEPIFSVLVAFYAPATITDVPQDFADLEGKRLCRPTGYFTFDLEQRGLVPGENVTLRQPPTVSDCFEALERGDVDFVTINRFTAEKAIAQAGLTGLVAPIDTIVSTQDLHLVAHERNAEALRQMSAFNEGLKRLKESGRFARISSAYFQLHDEEVERLANGG